LASSLSNDRQGLLAAQGGATLPAPVAIAVLKGRTISPVIAFSASLLLQREKPMSATDAAAALPYAVHLDIKFDALDLIDVPSLVEACTDQWYNQTLCKVNDSVVRLGVMQGEYHWHKHDDDDEFFFVLSGTFIIDLEGRSVALSPRQGFVVPKGVIHRTRAPEKAVVLMVETATIVPTGDA
jgi:mannose-6-phosphate isomerase-like protein (cupin superfamily)